MTAERNIARLVAETGYSTTTVKKWWKHGLVRKRTAADLQKAATEHGIRRARKAD